jgi:hypothetical protein
MRHKKLFLSYVQFLQSTYGPTLFFYNHTLSLPGYDGWGEGGSFHLTCLKVTQKLIISLFFATRILHTIYFIATNQPRNTLSYMNIHKIYCPLWQFTIVTLQPCDNFLQWHSDPKWTDYLSTSKMDGLSQCDIFTHCNFGQPMAVTFCPILIFSSVGFFAFKETFPWDFWHLKGQ